MLNVEELQKVREYLIYKGGLAVEDILRDDELLQQLGIDQTNITLKDMENVLSGFDEVEYLKERLKNIDYILDMTAQEVKQEKRNKNINAVFASGAYLLALASSIYSIKNVQFNSLTAGFTFMGLVTSQGQMSNKKDLSRSLKEQKKYQKKRDELNREIQKRMS